MKISHLFGQTLREAPAEAETIGHQLLLRAGFIRSVGTGTFAFLPLARRTLAKIENLLRQEMDRLGGQEVSLPFVQPAELWQASGRWCQPELTRLQDRQGHSLSLASAYQEVISDLVRREVQSYKQLPRLLYHFATLWRDEERPRNGLLRARQFPVFGCYSLAADETSLEQYESACLQACLRFFRRCGLEVSAVAAGVEGPDAPHAFDFVYLTPIGEESILRCDRCGYLASHQAARFRKPPAAPEDPQPLEKVQTPACKTIEDLANFLGVPKSRTAKAVFFIASVPVGEKIRTDFIFAVIRGDMELNEARLASLLGACELRPATEEEIRAIGAEPGFASPIGLKRRPEGKDTNVRIIVDDSIPASPNLVAGANEADYHLLNTNYGRDYQADLIADIALAQAGAACPQCGAPLRLERGVEIGNLSRDGTRFAEALGSTFLDKDGQLKPVLMASGGIGLGRLLTCLAEAHHDEHGLVWPVTIAPFQVHLILLRGKSTPQAEEIANRLYADLQAAGLEVLYDDREESPGVKFNDADLIGCPVRLTVSERALAQGGVEMKLRHQPEKSIVSLDGVIAQTQAAIHTLLEEIASNHDTAHTQRHS